MTSTNERQEKVSTLWSKSVDQEASTSLSHILAALQAMDHSGLERDFVRQDLRRGGQEVLSEEVHNLVSFDMDAGEDVMSTTETFSVVDRNEMLEYFLEQLDKECDSSSAIDRERKCSDCNVTDEDSYEQDSLVLARRRLKSLSYFQSSGVLVWPHSMHCSFDELSDLDDDDWNTHYEDLHVSGQEEATNTFVCEPKGQP